MVNSILIMITKAPYGRENVYGGLYTAIACLERKLSVTVVLVNDGVYSAMKGQASYKTLGYPNIEDLFYALFPPAKIFVDQSSMDERGIQKEDLIEIVEVIDEEELLNRIREHGEAIITY